MNDFEVICRQLIEKGRKIFPLRAGSKVPRRKKWYDCATQSDDEMLAVMLNAQREDGKPTGIGCCVGAVSEMLTLDVDYKHPEAIDFEEKHRTLLEQGLVVRSGGGRHYHFYHPYGETNPIVSEIGKIERGIDLLCDMNPGVNPRYVVIPPSIHPNGTPYKYEDDFGATLADTLPYMDPALLALVEDRENWTNLSLKLSPHKEGRVTLLSTLTTRICCSLSIRSVKNQSKKGTVTVRWHVWQVSFSRFTLKIQTMTPRV